MIYKNKDGSIYKIERKTGLYETDDIEDFINEINEVLNYLLEKTEIIKDKVEPVKPVEPSKVPGNDIETGKF